MLGRLHTVQYIRNSNDGDWRPTWILEVNCSMINGDSIGKLSAEVVVQRGTVF
jgi:hypothetical protein